MKVNIPSQSRRILQDNDNPFNGNIAESFNLDLNTSKGKFGVTRTKKIADVEKVFHPYTTPVLGLSSGTFGLFYAGGEAALDNIYQGGISAFSSTFVRDSSSANIGPDEGDLLVTSDKIYITGSISVFYTTMDTFGIWTEISSPALTDNTMHLLTAYGDKVYVTNQHNKIGVIDSSNTLSLTGTSTLDLAIDGYCITVLMTGLDRIWVGVSGRGNRVANGICYIYEWDGESENVPNQRYEIDASGLICGVVKDGIPYVLDTNGRLLKYAGASFVEVARFPYKEGELMYGFDSGTLGLSRAINPRSITVDGDEILINISNRLEGDYFADFPSGVWAYSEENGLYHKLSASYQDVSDIGTTNISDYGQKRVVNATSIFVHNINQNTSIYDVGEGGRIIFAQQYFNSADSGMETSDIDTTVKTALFTNDTKENTQKFGYFITPEIHTSDITESWQNIYAKFKPFLDSGDKIVVKYRTEMKDKTVADVAWLNTQTILTSTDVSGYEQGDEIQFIQGIGSGKSFHIQSITSNGSSYTITLDESFAGATGTAKAEFSNFKKAGEITYATKMKGWKELPLAKDNNSPVAQFKVCMQFTGKNELYGITINSNKTI